MLPFLLVPLAAAFGLALGGQPAQPPVAADTVVETASVTESTGPTVIQFENQAWDMATVYVVPQSGMSVRIGQVTSGSVARLTVPRGIVASGGTVQIVAVPFATNRVVSSGPVSLYPGEALRASLASSANLLSVLPVR